MNTIEQDTILYRLNPDVRKFFKQDWATNTLPMSAWRERGVSKEILDEMSSVFITYGIKDNKDGNTAMLSSWSRERGAEIHFTLHLPNLSNREYDTVDRAKLMDLLQAEADKFFKNFHLNNF